MAPLAAVSSVQTSQAAKSAPAPAISETSGRSRTPSAGTPAPRCHAGFAYPLVQVPTAVLVSVLVEQLLFPPPPATMLVLPRLSRNGALALTVVLVRRESLHRAPGKQFGAEA